MKYCKNGHAKTPDNTYVRTNARGWVMSACRICRKESDAKRDRSTGERKSRALQKLRTDNRERAENLKRQLMQRELQRVLEMPLCDKISPNLTHASSSHGRTDSEVRRCKPLVTISQPGIR